MNYEKRRIDLRRICCKKKRNHLRSKQRKEKHNYEPTIKMGTVSDDSVQESVPMPMSKKDIRFWQALHDQTCENVYSRITRHPRYSTSSVRPTSSYITPNVSYASILTGKYKQQPHESNQKLHYRTISFNTDINSKRETKIEDDDVVSIDLNSNSQYDISDIDTDYEVMLDGAGVYQEEYDFIDTEPNFC